MKRNPKNPLKKSKQKSMLEMFDYPDGQCGEGVVMQTVILENVQ